MTKEKNLINQFTFFRNYHEIIKELEYEKKCQFLIAINDYVFEDVEPTFEGLDKAIWNMIKVSLDVSKNKSKNAKKPLYINEKKENQMKIKSKSNQNQTEIKSKSNENQMKIKSKSNQNHCSISFSISSSNKKDNKNNKKSMREKEEEEGKKNIEEEFEELWSIYPNKKGKTVAMQKYSLARKQGATYEEVRQGLEHYIKYCETIDQKFIKHGSTWFNQKGWMDEYAETCNTPEWFNKNVEKEQITKEEQEEIDKLLNELNE